jgi:predicted AAA+ superfamily ATPase
MPYLPRLLTPSIEHALQAFPCVFINGPRQSGKTTLAKRIWNGNNVSYVNFDDIAALTIANTSPETFLSGYTNRLILDEIQLVPALYRALKASIDEQRETTQDHRLAGIYILTGSTNILALPKLADALVGRMIIKTLYPFSAAEVQGGKGDFITRLKLGQWTGGMVSQFDLIDTLQTATFPEIRTVGEATRADWLQSYLSTLIQRDVQQIMDIEKSTLLPQLLRLLATRAGSILNEADLARGVKENAVTTKRYRTILDLLFLTLTVPPWFRNLGKRLIKSPKIFLMDTNMLAHLLGRTLKDIEQSDPGLLGHVLENFVATELIKQIAQPIHQAGLYYFRTADGREVDFVIEFPDQQIVGIEVKAAETLTSQDWAGLQELQNLAGRDFAQGCILYRGRQILKISDKIWALPLSVLWQ